MVSWDGNRAQYPPCVRPDTPRARDVTQYRTLLTFSHLLPPSHPGTLSVEPKAVVRAALSSVAAADNGCRLDGHRAALPPADLALRCLLGSLLDNMHPPNPNPNQSPTSSPTPPSSPPPSPKLKGANGVPITPETPMVKIGASVPPARTSSLPHMMPLAGLSERERRRQRHSHHQDTRRNSRNKLGGNGGGSGGGRGGGRGSVDRNHGALSPATDDDSDEAPITSEDLACGSASAILTAAARSFGKWCAARLPQAQVCWESTPGHTTRLEPHRCLAYINLPFILPSPPLFILRPPEPILRF